MTEGRSAVQLHCLRPSDVNRTPIYPRGATVSYIIPAMLADAADLQRWTQAPVPDNADTYLRSCSSMVSDATRLAVYRTDPTTGLPTDPTILDAFRDATCIQAAAWITLGIDPLTGGFDTTGVKSSKKIGSAAITVAGADQAAAARAYAAANLVPEAIRVLRVHGLISAVVAHT